MCKQNQMHYLEMHNINDGIRTFKCGTKYDWYILEKNSKYTTSRIKDERGTENILDLSQWCWLPNFNFELIPTLIAKRDDKKCEVIYSRTNYGSDKKHVSKKSDLEYKFPLIHTITKSNGIRYMYSSTDANGHFGVPKVIFGDSSISSCVLDEHGVYGLTEHAIGLCHPHSSQLVLIKNYIESQYFNDNILHACMWSNFQIDWRLFASFKDTFYLNNQVRTH